MSKEPENFDEAFRKFAQLRVLPRVRKQQGRKLLLAAKTRHMLHNKDDVPAPVGATGESPCSDYSSYTGYIPSGLIHDDMQSAQISPTIHQTGRL